MMLGVCGNDGFRKQSGASGPEAEVMMPMKALWTAVALATAIFGATAAAAGDSGDSPDSSYGDAWLSDNWNGAGWYVTDTIGGYAVPLKGPFNSSGDCTGNLPNDPNPSAESHSWYCHYFATDPTPPQSW